MVNLRAERELRLGAHRPGTYSRLATRYSYRLLARIPLTLRGRPAAIQSSVALQLLLNFSVDSASSPEKETEPSVQACALQV